MKKLITLLSLVMLVGFTFAQQAATTTTNTTTLQTANKVMQADAKPSTLKVTPADSHTPAAGCSHGAAKTCSGGPSSAKPACCQQGAAQGCSGHGTSTKVEEKKAQ
ncbi:MAG: hypothetical protein KA149_03635 [Chitinophagales bacterium]|nr:hypothetical protein [Chitinophagales bacterium]